MDVTREKILNALKSVHDSEIGTNIVSLGLVREVKTDGGISVGIELTTPSVSDAERIEREAREAISSLTDGAEVEIRVAPKLGPRKTQQDPSGLAGVKNVIAVASGKGGVGKSTVAASMAKLLAQRGYKVGLLDTDIFGPSIPSLFNRHRPELEADAQQMAVPVDVEGLKLMSFGFVLGESPAVMRGPMVTNYVNQFLHAVGWGELDYLFLDLPPGTGDVQLTITQQIKLDGAVVVTTPQALSFADVGKAILMFDKVSVPVLGVVENMAYFRCPDCGSRHAVFGEGAAERLKERFGTPILAELPLSQDAYGGTMDRHIEDSAVDELATRVLSSIGEFSLGLEKPEVDYDESQLRLTWPSGETLSVEHRALRASCQCAVCVDEHTGERKVHYEDIDPAIKPQETRPLGNYALYIKWSDGHATGFFPYSLIREVAEQATR
ncbi:MAG: P-loop NTPase [Spirochaetota bacterium]